MTKTEVPVATLRETIAISYGNLAMAHYSVDKGDLKYSRTAYMIRAKLTKGLKTETMSIGSLFDDEKFKLKNGNRCTYCGSVENLALDHFIPKSAGGLDTGDNLVPACRSCNSSKGKSDVLEWYQRREVFPPLMVIRRYLKITVEMAQAAGVLDSPIDSKEVKDLPVRVDAIPIERFPLTAELAL